ncbi:FkbM family methyltransferase [Sulfitobacter aestuarii]|uniref:FkbM family methyltransferase n=1 Tax=Sulfitobacter aestuarii TaxID=2161676 RepID=A0ABW5U6K2_9RHOB
MRLIRPHLNEITADTAVNVAQDDGPHVPAELAALREAFRQADKPTRRALVPHLRPTEIEFAGIHMYVDPRDNYTDRRIWLDGHPPEMRSLTALMERIEGRNALIFDIGANCGAFAVPLGLAAGPGSRVIAFEPNPVMIGRLGHNIALNNLGHVIRIEGCAIAGAPGEAMLHLRRGNHGQSALEPIFAAPATDATLVPLRPLSDFLGTAEAHEVTVLKIDIEGGEDAALAPLLAQGAECGFLPEAMLIETAHARHWQGDLIGRITACGYAPVFEAEGNTLFVRQGRG